VAKAKPVSKYCLYAFRLCNCVENKLLMQIRVESFHSGENGRF